MSGCSCGNWRVTEEVTPWFRIEEREPYFEMPHAMRVGEHGRRASIRRGDTWQSEDIGGSFGSARPLAGAKSVLVRYGPAEWRLYREEAGRWLRLERCSDEPVVLSDAARLLCITCRAPRANEGPCTGVFVTLYDRDGALRSESALPLPSEYGNCALGQLQAVGRWNDDTAAVAASLRCAVPVSGQEGTSMRRDALWSVSLEEVRTVVSMKKAVECRYGSDWSKCLPPGQTLQQLP